MKKLKLQIQITVDGYVAGPNGELDWMTLENDTRIFEFIVGLADSSDTILLGRKMTDEFVNYWEKVVDEGPQHTEYPIGKRMVDTPKVVFTKTLTQSRWNNTTLAKGNLREEIETLKKRDGKDLLVYGGASFVSALIQEDLIDEYYLFVNPVLIGEGMRIFDRLEERRTLTLIEATSYPSGVTVLRYKRKDCN